MDDRKRHNLERKWEKQDRAEVDKALRDLLKIPEGRKYLWWLLRIGRVGTQPFSNNALTTSFACGELNVGQQILDHIISVDPAGYVRMMQEQADARTRRDAALFGDTPDSTDFGDPSADTGDAET